MMVHHRQHPCCNSVAIIEHTPGIPTSSESHSPSAVVPLPPQAAPSLGGRCRGWMSGRSHWWCCPTLSRLRVPRAGSSSGQSWQGSWWGKRAVGTTLEDEEGGGCNTGSLITLHNSPQWHNYRPGVTQFLLHELNSKFIGSIYNVPNSWLFFVLFVPI